ncbi:MAG: hypothetical protein Q4E89_13695 [Eubacteriales bacterium]|nr:hypothetical protein [Eubacteriales bacterium]
MNLPQFLKQVDAAAQKLPKDKLITFIHKLAFTLPEYQREDFLGKLYDIGEGESEDSGRSEAEQLNEQEIQKELHSLERQLQQIEEGEICLIGTWNEEYDEWYNSSVDEFLFEDPKDIIGILQKACTLVHQCVDREWYREGYNLGNRLMGLMVMVEGDYADYGEDTLSLNGLRQQGLVSFNFNQLLLDTLYAAYRSCPLEERPEALFQIIYNSESHDVTLEKLMQAGAEELDEFDDFLKLWIEYLAVRSGREERRLLADALPLLNDSAASLEIARRFSALHPEIYEQILAQSLISGGAEEKWKVGEEALCRIKPQYIVRSRIALLTAQYALELKKQEEAEKCWLEAFRSDTRPIHYMRLAVECSDFTKYRQEVRQIYHELLKTPQKESVILGESAENRIGKNTYYILEFLEGEFQKVILEGMNEKKALGWSFTFMKSGIALFLLYLYRGKALFSGCASMCSRIAEEICFTKEGYSEGLIRSVNTDKTSLFWECFDKWRTQTSMSEEEQEKILKKLDQWIRLRVEGIMQANRRNYYAECAAFIAALGEVRESRGEYNGKARLMEAYRSAYSRRTAFHREMEAFGMKRKKK